MENLHRISTGILDIHGKEICVGDIVRSYTGEIMFNYADNKKVICKSGKFYLDNEDGTSSLDFYRQPLEIIGNIKENPELFKEGRRISFWDH